MGGMADHEAGDPDMKAVSAATYAATADHFDDAALSFWDRFGRSTVARIGVRPAQRVFDACCGTGASAIPAAQMVGNDGQVLGFDLAEPALVLARAKARARGAGHRVPGHGGAARRGRGVAGTGRHRPVATGA